MEITWLPTGAPLSEYEEQARVLEGDPDAARLAVARRYGFADWAALASHVAETQDANSPIGRFERAVDAVITGDDATLRRLVEADPQLVHARSSRVTPSDPPQHRATLLHYLAANGVEDYRQKSPANAVEVASMLLRAGADPDALADMYGGKHATLPMLVSSSPPAEAGVQVPLVDVLVQFGASVDPIGEGTWRSPLMTALAFGFTDAAEALVRHGAKVERLSAAAGLGRVDLARTLMNDAPPADRHRALALAAQLGRTEIVRLLLDAGEDPDRYNPAGNHSHTTPLHQAVWSGHLDVVRLLVERGARLDVRDTIHGATPLGWAEYGRRTEVADYLRARGAP